MFPVSASLVAQRVKNPPAVQETWVQCLGWQDTLEKQKATHSSILAWRIPWTVESMGHKESDTTERLSHHITILSTLYVLIHLIHEQFSEVGTTISLTLQRSKETQRGLGTCPKIHS